MRRCAPAENYIKNCDAIWGVAPITRAVDDKSAKDLPDGDFRRKAFMDGKFNAISFLCTKVRAYLLLKASTRASRAIVALYDSSCRRKLNPSLIPVIPAGSL